MILEMTIKSTINLGTKLVDITIKGDKKTVETLKTLLDDYITQTNKERSYPWEIE